MLIVLTPLIFVAILRIDELLYEIRRLELKEKIKREELRHELAHPDKKIDEELEYHGNALRFLIEHLAHSDQKINDELQYHRGVLGFFKKIILAQLDHKLDEELEYHWSVLSLLKRHIRLEFLAVKRKLRHVFSRKHVNEEMKSADQTLDDKIKEELFYHRKAIKEFPGYARVQIINFWRSIKRKLISMRNGYTDDILSLDSKLRRVVIAVLRFFLKIKLNLSKKQLKENAAIFNRELSKDIGEESEYHVVSYRLFLRNVKLYYNQIKAYIILDLHDPKKELFGLLRNLKSAFAKKQHSVREEIHEDVLERQRNHVNYELSKLEKLFRTHSITILDYHKRKAVLLEKLRRLERVYSRRKEENIVKTEFKKLRKLQWKKKHLEEDLAQLDRDLDQGTISELEYHRLKVGLIQKLRRLERTRLKKKEKPLLKEEHKVGLLHMRKRSLESDLHKLDNAFAEGFIDEINYHKEKASLIERLSRLEKIHVREHREASLKHELRKKRMLLWEKKNIEYELSKLDKAFSDKVIDELNYHRMKINLLQKLRKLEELRFQQHRKVTKWERRVQESGDSRRLRV